MRPNPDLFAVLLLTALWLAVWDLADAWWSRGAIRWLPLWEAVAAAGLAVLAMLQ
jgi:hypothetical protein